MNSRSAEVFNLNALLGVKDFITISRRVNVVMLSYWGPLDFSQRKIEHAKKKKRREASIEAIFALIQKSWAILPQVKQTDWK